MCRTGVGGAGSTYQISFGTCQKYTSESAARAAAERWVRGECAAQLVELAGVPAKTSNFGEALSAISQAGCGRDVSDVVLEGPAR